MAASPWMVRRSRAPAAATSGSGGVALHEAKALGVLGYLDDPSQTLHEGGLHLRRAVKKKPKQKRRRTRAVDGNWRWTS